MENSKWLGRQALLGTEPGFSRLPVWRAESLSHWWGPKESRISCHQIFLLKIRNVYILFKRLSRDGLISCIQIPCDFL